MALNEFGAKMDSNGYAPSLFITKYGVCWRCHKELPTERHEVFGGARRSKSKSLGLWLDLCAECHRTGLRAVHQSKEVADRLKSITQQKAMLYYDWDTEEWLKRFYKNYIREEEENV